MSKFDPIQQAKEISHAIGLEIQVKYAKGQNEHGGNFFQKPTVRNIREEVLDLASYTHVQAEHQIKLIEHLQETLKNTRINGITSDTIEAIKQAIDLAANL